MFGHTQTRPSDHERWVGKRVNRNGTAEYGTVLRAYWRGTGQPVKLSVDWDVQTLSTAALTDSEHVTIVKENTNG
jgi:hypothetical protein